MSKSAKLERKKALIYRTTHQYQVVEHLQKIRKSVIFLLNWDFSQDYSCKYVEELKSVHFGASIKSVCILEYGVQKDHMNRFVLYLLIKDMSHP